jgi:hypothetical protein
VPSSLTSTFLCEAARSSFIFATAGDPVGNNLVASPAQPGGNVTGLSLQAGDLAGKRLELLREIVPGLRSGLFGARIDGARAPQLRCRGNRSPSHADRMGAPQGLEATMRLQLGEGVGADGKREHRIRLARGCRDAKIVGQSVSTIAPDARDFLRLIDADQDRGVRAA